MNIAILNLASAELKHNLGADELKQIRGGSTSQIAVVGPGGGIIVQTIDAKPVVELTDGQISGVWLVLPDGTTIQPVS